MWDPKKGVCQVARIIGVRHRTKKTAADESRPTEVVILDGGKANKYNLESETDELDFVKGEFPTKNRKPADGEDLSAFKPHHITWKDQEDGSKIATKVPAAYDGLQAGDTVAMILGGSGDKFAFALSRRAETLGGETKVLRVPSFTLKEWRNGADKDDDATFIAELCQQVPELFRETTRRDRDLINLRELYYGRTEAMQARIACEQRLRQRLIGRIFCSEDGGYPEGTLEDLFLAAKADDKILTGLLEEEKKRENELTKAVTRFSVFTELFEPIKGIGPMIAARLIVAVSDIRRFGASPPDPDKMNALYAESNELERRGRFEEDLDKIQPRVAELEAGGEHVNKFRKLQMVRSWKRANGQEEEALLLDRAIELAQKRYKLRKNAKRKGASKLKAFCGVHVLPDGRFPRRRRGEVANWSEEGRQALYLLGDQFNRRAKTYWGERLREYKVVFRERHPEVVMVEGKKRYSNGHIHKMGIWRTLTKFVEWLYKAWSALEEGKEIPDPPTRRMTPAVDVTPTEEVRAEA